MIKDLEVGDCVQVRAHRSKPGNGLTYPAFSGRLSLRGISPRRANPIPRMTAEQIENEFQRLAINLLPQTPIQTANNKQTAYYQRKVVDEPPYVRKPPSQDRIADAEEFLREIGLKKDEDDDQVD